MDSIFNMTRQLFQKSGLTGGPAPRPPLRMEPKGIDLHDLDYDQPKVSSKRATNTLFSKQNCTQLLENSSKPANKMNSASSPCVSKPSYTSANPMPACPDIIKSEKSSLAHSTTEQLPSAKTPDTERQVKEHKGNIVQSARIKNLVIEALTQKLPERQQITLFTFCLLGHDENARTKITPGLKPFANSLRTMNKGEKEAILEAATRFIRGEEQKEQYKWVVDTLTNIEETDIQFPVRQEQSDMMRSFIASASTVQIHCEPTSQPKTIGPANQDEAKAPLSPLCVKNQFAAETAHGNTEMGKRSVEAYPKTNASLNKDSSLSAMKATKNPHDVAPTLVIEALTQKLPERQQITLFTFCLLGHDENARTKITPGLKSFANSLKTMNKDEKEAILEAATHFIHGEEQKEQYKWVVDTLTNE